MTTPTTAAGRALLARENEYGEFVPNIEADDIAAIEREAAAQERERFSKQIRDAVQKEWDRSGDWANCWDVASAILAEHDR